MDSKPALRHVEIIKKNKFNVVMQEKRRKMGLTCSAVGKKAGINKSYISEIERGNYEPSIEIGIAICEVLDMDKKEFIDYTYRRQINKTIEKLKEQCEYWDLEMPPGMKENTKEYLDNLKLKSYEKGFDEGRKSMALEIKNRLEGELK